MIKVLRKRLIKLEQEASPYFAELICDEADELPQPDHFGSWKIDMGSIAHVINTGEMYRLNSRGDWVLQKKTESEGVTFTEADKAKLNSLTNPILLKGRVDTAEDLPYNAETGWLYFVGQESAKEFAEYIYTEDGKWEYIGDNSIEIDTYSRKQIDDKLNTLVSKTIAIPAKTDLKTLITSGFYRIASSSSNYEDYPTDFSGYDQMLVMRGGDTCTQIIYSYNHPDKFALRSFNGIGGSNPVYRDWVYYNSTDLTEQVASLQAQLNAMTMGTGQILETGQDLNDIKTPGVYRASTALIAQSLLNNPLGDKSQSLRLEVSYISGASSIMQKIYPNNKTFGGFYIRIFNSEIWGNWFKFSGEEIMTAQTVSSVHSDVGKEEST